MGTYRVLVSCPTIHDRISEYDALFERHGIEYDAPEVEQGLSESELLDTIGEYDAILCGDDELTGAVLRASDRLQVVSKWGVGIDNIDVETAEELDIAVYNTPNALGDEVADVVLGYAVMLARDLHVIDRHVREGKWSTPRGISLNGKTFGVVGVGDIGTAVARRASAFGMEVLGNDVVPLEDELVEETGIERVGLQELLDRSTFVSLNCSLTEETEGLIGWDELEAIGPEGYVINTARGELVDETAMREALEEDVIAGAALDVFQREPLPRRSPLVEFDDVVLGSHNAQNTHAAVKRVNDRVVENLIDGLVNQ